MATLQVLIATHGPEGLSRVGEMDLPKLPCVTYLVAWQMSEGAPSPLPAPLEGRDDIRVLRNPGIGLSQNRNFLFDHATADILLLADNDLRYLPSSLSAIAALFDEDPALDIACFRFSGEASRGKAYPEAPTELSIPLPKGYFFTSFEIAVRRSAFGTLRFDERLGLGTRLGAGEEEAFMFSALRRGLKAKFFPITICSHPGSTTGSAPTVSAAALRGMGAVIRMQYPSTCVLRIPLKAWRLARRGQARFLPALAALASGASVRL